jgi:hypothetical protein
MDTDYPWLGLKRPKLRIELRRGHLKNGNPSGDYMKAPRCGARNRQGEPCRAPAMRGRKRCRLHGGKSTGARTKAGIQRIRAAHWKHGARSARLQADYRKWKRRQEAKETAEILNHLMEARKDVPPIFYAIMRQPYVPRVRVRYQGPGIYRGGPPQHWEDDTTEREPLWKGSNPLIPENGDED